MTLPCKGHIFVRLKELKTPSEIQFFSFEDISYMFEFTRKIIHKLIDIQYLNIPFTVQNRYFWTYEDIINLLQKLGKQRFSSYSIMQAHQEAVLAITRLKSFKKNNPKIKNSDPVVEIEVNPQIKKGLTRTLRAPVNTFYKKLQNIPFDNSYKNLDKAPL